MLPIMWKMSTKSSIYLEFAYGAIRHTQNLYFVAWVIYAHLGQLVSSRGVCLWPSSNDVDEYSVLIKLLRDAISNGIQFLEVLLDSNLAMSQLNGMYRVRDPTLLRIL